MCFHNSIPIPIPILSAEMFEKETFIEMAKKAFLQNYIDHRFESENCFEFEMNGMTLEIEFSRGMKRKSVDKAVPCIFLESVKCVQEGEDGGFLDKVSGKGIVTRVLDGFLSFFPGLEIDMFIINDAWRSAIDKRIAEAATNGTRYPWQKGRPTDLENNNYIMNKTKRT